MFNNFPICHFILIGDFLATGSTWTYIIFYADIPPEQSWHPSLVAKNKPFYFVSLSKRPLVFLIICQLKFWQGPESPLREIIAVIC